jgi:4-alpha-glucanotransferase
LKSFATTPHWARIGSGPHHGIALPLFSLRSHKSSGIGEFYDLFPLIEWCKEVGFDTVQLLPLYDTGEDNSPYNALSSCALDPIYLSLEYLPDRGPLPKELKLLSQTTRVQRREVRRQKMEWLQSYVENHSDLLKLPAYENFVSENRWVQPYALFKRYKEIYGGTYWRDWPVEAQRTAQGEPDPFYALLQFFCHEQMKAVYAHASKHNVFLKGDIPILISPDSADVWASPQWFDTSMAAGAPPDAFTPLGQKWGFPLYNWAAMRKDGYSWWKQRLKSLGTYFHLYRIDHVVGLFRMWGIPLEKKALEGKFFPSDPSLWVEQGRHILEMMIAASPLLPIAEDLGTIPQGVRPLLKELGICSTKLLRWERRWEGDGEFVPYDQYEPFSITTLSTADTETTRLWWKNCPEESIPFAKFKGWKYEREVSKEQLFEILYDSHHTSSRFHINLLHETLALFPELVGTPTEERINVPGTVDETNWSYRFKPSVEEIVEHKGLREALKRLLI